VKTITSLKGLNFSDQKKKRKRKGLNFSDQKKEKEKGKV
jgi:hypothetical protein